MGFLTILLDNGISLSTWQYTHTHTVHCRKRHSDRGRLKPASTSSNVYWQFEKENDSRSGEPLSWGERCRIKHLPTRMYLTVSASLEGGYTVRAGINYWQYLSLFHVVCLVVGETEASQPWRIIYWFTG